LSGKIPVAGAHRGSAASGRERVEKVDPFTVVRDGSKEDVKVKLAETRE
jgi:hypothetical protein